ncbi:MAG: hypothetical protein IV086_11900 [Hyphomonadaceae bacterium]|nr:MAG: hypothetical protein FD160_2495 [Caulobacteraceae bacterium]MBT9446394.1 hypothetical protein [Hyphomonadaceae bacterium]TPW07887.1 MAG: hypothetical protein FD124_835 [Alphaproteobacteria bacterium]
MKNDLTHEELAEQFRLLSQSAEPKSEPVHVTTSDYEFDEGFADDFGDDFDTEVANDRDGAIAIRFGGRFETFEQYDAAQDDQAAEVVADDGSVASDMPGLTPMLEQLQTETQETAQQEKIEGPAGAGFWGFTWALAWVGVAVGAPVAFIGPYAIQNQHPAVLAAIAAIAIAPALLIIYAANAAREARRAHEQTRRLVALAEQALSPTEEAETRARTLGRTVRAEIGALQSVVDVALDRFAELEAAASRNAMVFDEAVSNARDGAGALTETLRNERATFEGLTSEMRAQTEMMGENVGRQVRLMRETSRIVRQEFAAADETLQNHFTSFASSAALMAERTQAIDAAAAATQAATQRLDSTVLTALEALSQATALTDTARQSADAATQAASATAGAIRDTTRRAVSDARRVAQMIRHETQAMEESAVSTLSKLKEAADEARQASHEAQAAADRHADAIQRRLTASAAHFAQVSAQRPVVTETRVAEEVAEERMRVGARVPRSTFAQSAPVTKSFATPAEAPSSRFANDWKAVPAAPIANDAGSSRIGDRFGLAAPRPTPKTPAENALAILVEAGVNAASLFSTPDLDFIANRARQGGAARRQAVAAAAPEAVASLQDLFDGSETARANAATFRAKPELATQAGGKSLLVAYLLIDAALG